MILNKKIPISFLLQKIQFEFFIIVIYSIILGLLDQSHFLKEITIPLVISAILGTAISLLLAFRTSQAYERWWEARIIWGAIVNDSRTLIRQIQEFYKKSNDRDEFINSFVYRQIVWCYCLGEKLRKLPQDQALKRYLSNEQILELQKYNNIPNRLLDIHTQELSAAHDNQLLNDFQQVQIDSTITRLCDSMGKCERIKSTVFPRTYSLLLHFLIYVFATILPFGLDHVCGSNHPVIIESCLIIIITTVFMLIEKIAVYMQDPFENRPTDTPITTITQKIEIDLLQMINSDRVPQIQESTLYYEM